MAAGDKGSTCSVFAQANWYVNACKRADKDSAYECPEPDPKETLHLPPGWHAVNIDKAFVYACKAD